MTKQQMFVQFLNDFAKKTGEIALCESIKKGYMLCDGTGKTDVAPNYELDSWDPEESASDPYAFAFDDNAIANFTDDEVVTDKPLVVETDDDERTTFGKPAGYESPIYAKKDSIYCLDDEDETRPIGFEYDDEEYSTGETALPSDMKIKTRDELDSEIDPLSHDDIENYMYAGFIERNPTLQYYHETHPHIPLADIVEGYRLLKEHDYKLPTAGFTRTGGKLEMKPGKFNPQDEYLYYLNFAIEHLDSLSGSRRDGGRADNFSLADAQFAARNHHKNYLGFKPGVQHAG